MGKANGAHSSHVMYLFRCRDAHCDHASVTLGPLGRLVGMGKTVAPIGNSWQPERSVNSNAKR